MEAINSRRTGFYRGQGVARQRESPANRGSAQKRRAQRGYTPRSGPRMAASSASTLLQPSRPHRAGHLLRHSPIDAAPPTSRSQTRFQLRSPDWATMRPSFTLRRFKESREHPRSAARGKGFAKMTGLFASPLHRFVRSFYPYVAACRNHY